MFPYSFLFSLQSCQVYSLAGGKPYKKQNAFMLLKPYAFIPNYPYANLISFFV